MTGGTLNPIAFADVPELVTLIEYVCGREDAVLGASRPVLPTQRA
jgi:hypothetical protein